MRVHRPADAHDLAQLIRDANADARLLEARGGGSKAAFGGWRCEADILDVAGLAGVIDYDPAELVLTARAATPLAEVEALLQAHGQMLAFEPMDYSPLLGGPPAAATLGGIIAAGVAGPRRLSHGGPRDHLLGFQAVTGAGDLFKAGGKVVKNVTGFDLSKLMAGSWGALAVLTEVTLRVVPAPRDTATLVLHGLDEAEAGAAMGLALREPAEVSGAAWLPAWSRRPSGASQTVLRLEGFGPSVAARAGLLRAVLAGHGSAELLTGQDSAKLWRAVRSPSWLGGAGALWRLSLPPARGAEACALLSKWNAGCCMDWGGGLVWVLGPPGPDSLETVVRDIAFRMGGHATLVRPNAGGAPPASPFPPEATGVAALSARIRQAFDPRGVLADRRRVPAAAGAA